MLQVLSAHYGDQSDASKVVDVTKRIQTVVGGNPKDVSDSEEGTGGVVAAGGFKITNAPH